MVRLNNLMRYSIALICVASSWGPSAAQQPAEQPETVVVTLHAKTGVEPEVERVIARHWATARQLKLVRDTPHITVRGTENGNKTYFMDVFTWRDSRIPDAAPAEIQKIWADMNALVEARGGHRGLEIAAVSIVTP